MIRRIFSDCGRHRFLGDDVDPGLQRPHDDRIMRVIRRADDDKVRFDLGQHRIDILVDRRIAADHRAGALAAKRVLFDDRDEIDMLAPTGEQVFAPHGGSAISCPDQRKTAFLHRMILLMRAEMYRTMLGSSYGIARRRSR